MAEELNRNEENEEVKEEIVKIDGKAKKLSDDDVLSVTGGYKAKDGEGYAGGFYIQCPVCGNADRGDIKYTGEDCNLEMDKFSCKKCGFNWGVDYQGGLYNLGGMPQTQGGGYSYSYSYTYTYTY